MENEIERLMEKIERKMKDAKDPGNKELLERLKQEAEVQEEELDYEKKKFEEEQKEADKYTERLASLLLSAEFAEDYEEWMEDYKECLEAVTL
jgi:hypothetical protein